MTSGNVIYGASNSIQSGAPNPYSGETRVSTGFGGPGLNGARFDFGSSSTDILEFGIYVGDLETRANNGTSGRVSVTPLEVDLSITKTNTPGANGEVDQPADTLISGDNTSYRLVVANNGPDSISGAVVTDIVGTGLSCSATDVVSLSGDGVPSGSFTIADLTGSGITLGNLDDGDAATLTYACLVN